MFVYIMFWYVNCYCHLVLFVDSMYMCLPVVSVDGVVPYWGVDGVGF